MVPGTGIEPVQPYSRGILNPLCLPIPPPGHRKSKSGGASRSRTEVGGFAIRCMATLPTRPYCLITRLRCPSWSGKRGSNSRPQPWQGCALPLSYSRVDENYLTNKLFATIFKQSVTAFDALHSTDLTLRVNRIIASQRSFVDF